MRVERGAYQNSRPSGAAQQGKLPLYYTWYTGPLAVVGYFGLIEKHGDRWLCVFWDMAWLS